MTSAIENDNLSLLYDQRKIQHIGYEGDMSDEVGTHGITKIIAYGEPGECCYKPWFAVYIGEKIVRRVNASYVVDVFYEA